MALLHKLVRTRTRVPFEYQASQPLVLLVGFDSADRLRVRVTLEREGYCVLAGTVDEMPSILRILVPALIMVDVKTGLDPLDVVNRIRRSAECGSIPVVALTCDPVLGARIVDAQNGFAGFINTPLDLRHLGNQVAEYIP
jgi:CheY-like chemotaxis protein